MKKGMLRFCVVALAAVAIELVFFQGLNIVKLLWPGYQANILLSLDDFEIANWVRREDGTLESGLDPILVTGRLDARVDVIEVTALASKQIPYIDIFYINEEHPQYGELHLHNELKDGNSSVFTLDDDVDNLRIDLGDDAGVILRELTVRINPVEFRPSLSRIIAVILIYWSGVFLFSLQKMPDYHLNEGVDEDGPQD